MIELRTNGKKIINYSKVDITLSLDTVASKFSFDGLFDIENENTKDLYKPFTYKKADVWFIDSDFGINEKLITGVILNQALSLQKKPQLTNISGYSVTGILEDISVPTELYPLESQGLGLAEITRKFTKYLGLKLKVFDNAIQVASIPFDKAKARPGETIKSYLSNLCKVRNVTLAHDNLGRLLLYRVLAKIPPAAKINENDNNVSISIAPNGQGMHSHITIIRQLEFNDSNSGQYTIRSPFVPSGNIRPIVKLLTFGENDDVRAMAEAEACREAKNFPIVIEKQGWTIGGRLVRAGFYLEVTAPSIFLERIKLVIQTINFKEDKQNGRRMRITCVHPCVYTGVLPKKSPFK